MKRAVIKILVLVLVFAGAVLAASRILNQENGSTMEAMESATLPLVYMLNDGTQYNCLHGYVKEMSPTAMRDTLTPLEDGNTLQIQVQQFTNQIGDITFEVLSSDGEQVLENTKVMNVTEDETYVTATLELQERILINTEYVLKIQVMANDEPVYYYTRIIREDNLHTGDYLDFALGFYEQCITGNNLDSIATYIEPDSEQSNDNLAHVDIHSSMEQLAWGSLDPQIYYKPIPSLKEINSTTATLRMDYMISAQTEDGETEYYQVSEYYRMRYSDTRIMLLDFERDTTQVFEPESAVLTESGINLGIRGSEIEYKNDSSRRYFAFVQRNTLWMFDTSERRITRVFGFPQEGASDLRDTYDQHDIQIISIDESGNMYFLVCGYMNRGFHEGESGVAVYYFDVSISSVEECLFVDTKENYELLKRDVEALSYVSEDRNRFYICVDGSIYSIQLDTRQVSTVISDVRMDCFVSSESGRYLAWIPDNEPYNGDVIRVYDFDTQETRDITCQSSERIRPLAFMGEDLIYGVANTSDIDTEHEGEEVFPMKEVYIVNGQGETLTTYSASGYYVTDVTISDKLITLTRVTNQNGVFTEAQEDHIVSSTADESMAYGLTTQTSTRKQTEMVLRVGETYTTSSVAQIVRSQEIIYEGSKEVTLETRENTQKLYYVYAKGRLYDSYTAINKAINAANELMGVVVNSDWQNIWERGNKATTARLNLEEFPDIVNQASLDVSQWETMFGDNFLDLSGCSLDAVLYYVSEGTPVVAQTPVSEDFPEGVVIIAGYDEYNTILLRPGQTETFYWGLQDSTALFEEAGNIFLTYWDPISD